MQIAEKEWNITRLINWTSEYLQEKGFENAKLNAERMLAHVLSLDRLHLYLNDDRPLTAEELQRFKRLLQRRLRWEPLQYILGETEFMSLPFKVNPDVLIPRPETEILVEKVLEFCQSQFSNKLEIHILDIGTGSGCIAISLARYLSNAQITALDISPEALKIARANALLNQVDNRLDFVLFDFLNTDIPRNWFNKFHVIVSNPPYIARHEFDSLPKEVKDFEPPIALLDGGDGLTFHRKISETAPRLLKAEGIVAVELAMGQAEKVKPLFAEKGFKKITIFTDLTGIERVLIGQLNPELEISNKQGG
ncbi:MAG: peptide chain release factor N(5)-glutamine methyltransferase [Calditrichaeota bacterium]|nr:MAG: peptide chain release factor N(5)-glutamine methyltransferase [Calditrichota bacterium]